jgi:hypothetical protein
MRTPLSGVIGMASLLRITPLTSEQTGITENIMKDIRKRKGEKEKKKKLYSLTLIRHGSHDINV